MKNWFSKKTILGVALGGVGGVAYWYFVGCQSGSCAITSVWYHSMLYGAMMGALAVQSFTKDKDSGG